MSTNTQARSASRLYWLLGLGAWLASCTPLSQEARTRLDTQTGASLTVADSPLILARERRDLASHARDYLTLLAAEVNVSGRRQLVLVAHLWSTIDVRARGGGADPPGDLLLVADGRDLRLQPAVDSGSEAMAAARALGLPEDADVVTVLYPVEAEALRYVASAHQLAAALPAGTPGLPYGLWRDGRAAQLRLLEAIGR